MRKLVAAEKGELVDEVPEEQPAFFHDIHYVIRTWLERKLHHMYPDAGGYNDQCEYLMLDWHTLNMYQIRVEHGEFSEFPVPANSVPFQALMGD